MTHRILLHVGDLTCATPRFASRPTNWTWMDERGPALPRHGEQEKAHHRRRELGNNSTLYWCHLYLNLSQLPGVAPNPGVHQTPSKPPGRHLRNACSRKHPGQQRECILNDTSMHRILHIGDLTQCPAWPVYPPTGRGWTSKSQLCHTMDSSRKRTIDDASWATTPLVLVPPLTST